MGSNMNLAQIGGRIREQRKRAGYSSLNQFADYIRDSGCGRPSIAKLSRIETGEQPVALDLLPIISEATGIAPSDLRPDLAELLKSGGQ